MTKLSQKNQIEKLFFQNTTKIQSHTVKITPVIARKLLDNTDPKVQRKLTRAQVLFLSAEIKRGYWGLDGNSIKQDSSGNIIDGQHRLNACIETGMNIETIFVKGLKTENIYTIDMGAKARTLTDILEIKNRKKYKYGTNIAATVRFIYKFNRGCYSDSGSNKISLSSQEFLKWIDENPAIIDFVGDNMRLWGNGDKLVNGSVFCGLKWILDEYGKQESDKFFQKISDGIGIVNNSPIFALRKKILSTKFGDSSKKAHITYNELIYLILKTWNLFIKGKTVAYLKMPKEMPKIKRVKTLLFD